MIASATVAQAYIYWRQKDLMRDALSETRKAADAAKRSADAFVLNERAWVVATLDYRIPDPPPSVQWGADALSIQYFCPFFRNFGKSPATITRIAMKCAQIPMSAELPDEPDYLDALLVPGRMVLAPEVLLRSPYLPSISGTDIPAIKQKEQRLYIFGFVDYEDLEGKVRYTRFCFEYFVPAGYSPDPEGFSLSGPASYNQTT